jgi:ADP-heptose:LPS heptosyltransferase
LIISRTDAIGDVCLTLPAIGWLKSLHPEWRITLLVKAYAAPVARACHWVDEVAVLPESMNADQLSDWLRDLQADHIVHVFPNRRIAKAARQAGIPRRSGVWGRVYHWLNCNNRVWLSRARSTHHEAYLNLLLLAKVLNILCPNDGQWRQQARTWAGLSALSPDAKALHKDIVPHPYSRGNGREWPIAHFAQLAHLIVLDGWRPVVGGTSADAVTFAADQYLFPAACVSVMGADSLDQYMLRIGAAAGLVASSTGPLHIAALMGKPAVGVYAPKPLIHQQRWGAIGPSSTNLQAPGPCEAVCSNRDCACMRAISPDQVWQALQEQLTARLAPDAAL